MQIKSVMIVVNHGFFLANSDCKDPGNVLFYQYLIIGIS